MDVAVKSRATNDQTAPERQDLRSWIAQLRAADEVQDIKGAEREKEIGGIVDIYQRKIGNKAVLFDEVPGFPRGHRILANILTSVRRINITLGLDPDASAVELVHYWRRYMKDAKAIPPVTVQSGAVMENVLTGSDIDIFKIPVPRWHEHDGGYYIGTGDMVIMRDPGHRLDQLRRLSGAGPRAQRRHRDVLEGQARRHDQAALSRARRTLPDRRGVRHAPGACS